MTLETRHLPATYASIRFSGDTLDPDVITNMIGVGPTLSYRKGERFVAGRRRVEQQRTFGLWLYSTRDIGMSDSIESHLERIEELLLGSISMWSCSKLRIISTFSAENAVDLNVSLFWYGAAGSAFPDVSKSFKAIVALAGGTYETDFHRDEEVEVA